MRTRKIALSSLILCLALSGLVMTSTGCAGSRYKRSTGAYIDDKSVSTRVKTALFRDPLVSGFDVSVNTFRGEVQLNGFVDTQEQKDRAAAIAREVEGVELVTNNLEVKPASTDMGTSGSTIQGRSGTVTEPAPDRTVIDTETGPALERNLAPVRENPNTDLDTDLNDNLDADDRDRTTTPSDVRPLPPITP